MRINGQRSTPHVQEEYRNFGPIRYWVKRGDKTVCGPFYSRDVAEALAAALPAVNPTATAQQHASAAARMLADMDGGAA